MNIFRSIGERFNSQWNRKGTYNRFITVALAPSEEEFENQATATVTISHKEDPIITSIFAKLDNEIAKEKEAAAKAKAKKAAATA